MESDGVLAEITYQAFVECVGGTFEAILKKNETSHEVGTLIEKIYW